jgi:hypothetical protein
LIAEADEFPRETVERGDVEHGALQKGIAGTQGVGVTLEQWQVMRMGLREQQVHEPPPDPPGALDEEQIFGAEDHGAERAQVIGELANRLGVEAEAALARRPVHFDVVLALADDGAADEIAFLAVSNQWRAADAAEGAQGSEEVDGFEDVGFALGIVAQQQVQPR